MFTKDENEKCDKQSFIVIRIQFIVINYFNGTIEVNLIEKTLILR